METSKGAIEILTVVLLTGLMLGIVGAVFLWGEPLIRKNEGISVLQNAELFIKDLAKEIKNIANHPGRVAVSIPRSPSAQIQILLLFDPASQRLSLEVAGTAGTVYSTGSVPLGRNACAPDEGTVKDEQQTICVRSEKVGEGYITTYILKFIQLNTEGLQSFKIDLTGVSNRGGEGHLIFLENQGTRMEMIEDKEVLKTKIGVEIR